MFYHVLIRLPEHQHEVFGLDLSEEELRTRIIEPYTKGTPFVLSGVTVSPQEIIQIRIAQSGVEAKHAIQKVKDAMSRSKIGAPIAHELNFFNQAEDVTNSYITSPPGSHSNGGSMKAQSNKVNSRKVFVVHGRNKQIRDSMFAFLRALGLEPIEWEKAIRMTEKATPYVGEVLNKALSVAQAIVVVFTPDDEVRLRDEFHAKEEESYEKILTPQARPNVIFEAGMAMGRAEDRTLLVVVGRLRPFSDTLGRHELRLDGTPEKRKCLAQRLIAAGCPADLDGNDWLSTGDFKVMDTVKSNTGSSHEAKPNPDSTGKTELKSAVQGLFVRSGDLSLQGIVDELSDEHNTPSKIAVAAVLDELAREKYIGPSAYQGRYIRRR